MVYCGICRRAEVTEGKRLCRPCAAKAYAQVLRMERVAPRGARKDRSKVARGTPRVGYGTTWRYMRVRQTKLSLEVAKYEFRRVQRGYHK